MAPKTKIIGLNTAFFRGPNCFETSLSTSLSVSYQIKTFYQALAARYENVMFLVGHNQLTNNFHVNLFQCISFFKNLKLRLLNTVKLAVYLRKTLLTDKKRDHTNNYTIRKKYRTMFTIIIMVREPLLIGLGDSFSFYRNIPLK